MNIEKAMFEKICCVCQSSIRLGKGIALIDDNNSKTYCQRCYATEIKKTLPKMNLTDEVLATLTPREEKVMKMFKSGIALEDIAEHFQVDFARMRQIYDKALRKLRHPSRQKLM